jgi:hypothetical protein
MRRAPIPRSSSRNASTEVHDFIPVAVVIPSPKASSRSKPSRLAEAPFHAMTSTLASARRSAARRIYEISNCLYDVSDIAISLTL